MIETLKWWDQWFFIKINNEWTSSFFDTVLPYCRQPVFWLPLYIFLLAFFTLNFKSKGWWWSLLFVVTIALTDSVGTRVFKEGFHRLRPCSDPEFFFHVRLLLKNCSGGYSFVSNHAANHFGMATFFFITTRNVIGKWALVAFLWAAVISYAQVYVGVHYPFDVLAGAVLGILFGLFTGMLFNKRFGFTIFDNQPLP